MKMIPRDLMICYDFYHLPLFDNNTQIHYMCTLKYRYPFCLIFVLYYADDAV